MRKIHRALRPKPMSRCAMPPHASLKDDARRGARGALPTFVRRALGYFPTGESVRWNPVTRRFENVPWPLQSETKERVPQDATRVEPEDNADGRLREIWHHARVAGYEVKEIREFAADPDQAARWHLRMRGYDPHEGAERTRISVWQEQNLEGAIAVELHAAQAPLRRTMDLWLLRCRHPLRGKWLAHDEPWPGEAPVALALDPFRPMPAGELAPTGAKITGVSRPTLHHFIGTRGLSPAP